MALSTTALILIPFLSVTLILTRVSLRNWALCALEIGSMMDVSAASSAAIRMSVNEKVVYTYRSTSALATLDSRLVEKILRVLENFETRLKCLKV
jgi:hypothetical protein